MTRQHKKSFPWFLWHRRIGLVSILLMIILAITGIALNHTEGLELDQNTIHNDSLLNWYGLNPKGEASSFVLEHTRITQWSGKIFYNDQIISDNTDTLVGVARAANNITILAFTNSLLLLDANGRQIENTTTGFMPIRKLGMQDGMVIAEAETGEYYRADADIINWHSTDKPATNWSQAGPLDSLWQDKLKIAWRGEGLTAERVILDLHSGRIFNDVWGVYIMDASAVILIVLSVSGGWMWWTRKQKISGKKHYQRHHR
jgi:hypothetical protein